MEHAIQLSVAFQLVNNGPPTTHQTSRKRSDGGTRRNENGNGEDYKGQNKTPDKDFVIDEDDDLQKQRTSLSLSSSPSKRNTPLPP